MGKNDVGLLLAAVGVSVLSRGVIIFSHGCQTHSPQEVREEVRQEK